MQFLSGYYPKRYMWVGGICLSACTGVVLAWFAPFSAGWWVVACVILVCCWWRRSIMVLLFFCVVACTAGWWRGDQAMQHHLFQQTLHHQKVRIIGIATDEAIYGRQRQLEFVLTEVRLLEPHAVRIVGNVTVRGFGQAMVYRGDTVVAEAVWYPTRGNAVASMSFAEMTVIARDASWINNLRRDFAAGMQSALPEPVASLALGILIGQRTTLPDVTAEQLRMVGLTHIIAVSGYNLTVIVMACRRLLAAQSKFQATAACILLIMIFLLVTGTSPPVVRAGIISLFGIAAWYYGREFKPVVLLLLGAAVTVLANPFYIWGNVSWYLSFLAFYGVLVLAPLVVKRLWGTREPKLLGGLIVESACASIMVLPYLLYVFGEMSLVSLLANVLVVPAIPLAMLLGLFGGLAGMLIPTIAGWIAWPARWLMTYMLDVAQVLSRLPFAFAEGIEYSLAAMIAAYAALAGLTWILWHKTRHVERMRRLQNTV